MTLSIINHWHVCEFYAESAKEARPWANASVGAIEIEKALNKAVMEKVYDALCVCNLEAKRAILGVLQLRDVGLQAIFRARLDEIPWSFHQVEYSYTRNSFSQLLRSSFDRLHCAVWNVISVYLLTIDDCIPFS